MILETSCMTFSSGACWLMQTWRTCMSCLAKGFSWRWVGLELDWRLDHCSRNPLSASARLSSSSVSAHLTRFLLVLAAPPAPPLKVEKCQGSSSHLFGSENSWRKGVCHLSWGPKNWGSVTKTRTSDLQIRNWVAFGSHQQNWDKCFASRLVCLNLLWLITRHEKTHFRNLAVWAIHLCNSCVTCFEVRRCFDRLFWNNVQVMERLSLTCSLEWHVTPVIPKAKPHQHPKNPKYPMESWKVGKWKATIPRTNPNRSLVWTWITKIPSWSQSKRPLWGGENPMTKIKIPTRNPKQANGFWRAGKWKAKIARAIPTKSLPKTRTMFRHESFVQPRAETGVVWPVWVCSLPLVIPEQNMKNPRSHSQTGSSDFPPCVSLWPSLNVCIWLSAAALATALLSIADEFPWQKRPSSVSPMGPKGPVACRPPLST